MYRSSFLFFFSFWNIINIPQGRRIHLCRTMIYCKPSVNSNAYISVAILGVMHCTGYHINNTRKNYKYIHHQEEHVLNESYFTCSDFHSRSWSIPLRILSILLNIIKVANLYSFLTQFHLPNNLVKWFRDYSSFVYNLLKDSRETTTLLTRQFVHCSFKQARQTNLPVCTNYLPVATLKKEK